jgi:hypothetical protein
MLKYHAPTASGPATHQMKTTPLVSVAPATAMELCFQMNARNATVLASSVKAGSMMTNGNFIDILTNSL